MAQFFNIVTNASGTLTLEDVQRMCTVEGQGVQFLVEELNNGINGSPQLIAYTTASQSGEQTVFAPQTINISGQLGATNVIDPRQTVLLENFLIETNNVSQPQNVIRNTVSAQIVGENIANIVENRGSPKGQPNNTASQGQNVQWVKMPENNINNFDAVYTQNTPTTIKSQVCTPIRNQPQANPQSQVKLTPQPELPLLSQSAKRGPVRLYANKNRQSLPNPTTAAAAAATSGCQQQGNVANSTEDRLTNANLVNNRNSNTTFRSKMFGPNPNEPAVSKTPTGRGRAVVRPDTPMTAKGFASMPLKNPIIRKRPEVQYLSEKIKQAKQHMKPPMASSPQFQRQILQQTPQQQRQQQMGTNITQHQRQQLPTTPQQQQQQQQQRQQISNSPAARLQQAGNTSQQRQQQLVLTQQQQQQQAQIQRQPMAMTPQQRQQHQIQLTPVQQQMEIDPPDNTQDSGNMKQQSCGSQTDSESGSSRNFTFLQKSIDNPQNCIVQSQIDSNTAKMLVILQNGEQRLITFDIPNEDCTVQDLLEQANIPLCPETSISLVTDETLQINYVVEAGPGTYSYSAEGSEQSDSVSNPSPEKLPTSPDSSSPVFSPSEENSNSSMTQSEEAKYVDGKLAVCPNCGISSIDFNRCQRCKRSLPEDVKTVPANMAAQAKKENMLVVDTFYKKSSEQQIRPVKLEREMAPSKRGRGRARPMVRAKFIKEPECLTISSDDEDQGEGKFKKSTVGNNHPLGNVVYNVRNHNEPIEMILEKEPVITNNSVPNNNERNIGNEEVIKGGGRENEVQNMADGSIQAPHTSLICRTVRIGSYKYIPQERVVISQSGVRLGVPLLEDNTNFVPLEVKFKDVVKVLIHFGKAMPVLFFYTTTNAGGMIRELLGMQDPKGPYYDPAGKDHTHKRITLLPEVINEESKLILKTLFAPNDLLAELNNKEANDILLRASPKDSWQVQSMMKKSGQTVSTGHNHTTNGGVQTIMVYPPPPAKGGIAINTEDYACLGEDQFLNDVIIDFYLKYLTLEVLSEEDRDRTHVFSSYFYKRLTSPHAPATDNGTPLSPAAKRHARVQKWTKNVNIFEKDFIVIPINEHAHWFLAIICFPGFVGKVQVPATKESEVKKTVNKTKKPKEIKLQAVTIGNTTITPVTATITLDPGDEGSERDEAEGDDEEMEMDSDEEEETEGGEQTAKTPQKPTPRVPTPVQKEDVRLPCILIFDSLAGASRSRVVATLRDYLSCEYVAKMGSERTFSKDTIKGACPKVPQQSNFTDCGVYVLQYVESFFNDPIKNYTLPIKTLKQWFEEIIVTRKREELSKLLVRLMNATKGDRTILLPVLTFPTQEGRLLPKPENHVEMKAVKQEVESKKKSTSEMEVRSGAAGTVASEENPETGEPLTRNAQQVQSQSPLSSSNSNENSQTEMSADGKTVNRSSSETMSYLKAKRIPRLMQRTSESQDDKQVAKKHKGDSFDSCK